jgi:Protein of unknown function (DUF3224)
MTVRLELPFTITTWDVVPDEPIDERDAPDTGRVVLAKTYAGDDLTGTASGHALMTRGERGASYVAQERIIGTLRGHPGSFVLEHGAAMGEGQETVMRANIVAGSGTGELSGISGSGLVEHELLTLEVELPEW